MKERLKAKAATIDVEKRLLDARDLLKDKYRSLFKAPRPQGCRLYSDDSEYYLQWENTGLTSVGSVYLVKVKV